MMRDTADSHDNDNIPQRPFRRLSGSACNNSQFHNSLFSVHETVHDDSEDNEASNEFSVSNNRATVTDTTKNLENLNLIRDLPPKKPNQCGSTILLSETDNSTVTTYLDDDNETPYCHSFHHGGPSTMEVSSSQSSSEHSSRLSSHFQQAMLDQIKAREQPNMKVSTVPVDEESQLLQQRKAMVEKYWTALRERDLETWKNDVVTTDYHMDIVGPGGRVLQTLHMEEILPAAKAVFDSLPDFRFYYNTIEESNDQPGCLVLHDFVGSGTHTGAPFALGPLPAIPPTNTHIVLDEAETHYHFCPQTNKISKIAEIAIGENTGIPGIYTLCSRNYHETQNEEQG